MVKIFVSSAFGALNNNTSSQPPVSLGVIIVSSAIADSEALNAPTIKTFFASFFPADIHGKIPQIKKNKSACLFCVHQRDKLIQSVRMMKGSSSSVGAIQL